MKTKLLILGSARHGKDTCAEILRDNFGLSFESSSMAACKIFIFDELRDKYGYVFPEECFNDRINHRKEWFDLICQYNQDDKSRLAKEILKRSNCYVGMRDKQEIEACKKGKLFDLIIWIDASERLPTENFDSLTIDKSYADIIITNNSTYEEFSEKVMNLGRVLR